MKEIVPKGGRKDSEGIRLNELVHRSGVIYPKYTRIIQYSRFNLDYSRRMKINFTRTFVACIATPREPRKHEHKIVDNRSTDRNAKLSTNRSRPVLNPM